MDHEIFQLFFCTSCLKNLVVIYKLWSTRLKNIKNQGTLTYQVVVAHQISVTLGTFSEINNSSPSNNHSLEKIFLKATKVAPLLFKKTKIPR